MKPNLAEMRARGSISDSDHEWLVGYSLFVHRCYYCGYFDDMSLVGGAYVCLKCYNKVFASKETTGLDALQEWWT